TGVAPGSGSTVSAYVPFRPPGTGASMCCVVPDLIVYVLASGVPPSLPADAVTLTLAVPSGAVTARTVPLAVLPAAVARAPTGRAAGMNADSWASPLPRSTRTAATTGTERPVGVSTREPGSPRVTSPRSTAVVIPAFTCTVSWPAGVIGPEGEASRTFRSASVLPGVNRTSRTAVASFGMPGRTRLPEG